MSDRDDLADIIEAAYYATVELNFERIADAVMAAGWMNLHALQDDLDELEAEDPDVKAAAEAYERMQDAVNRTLTNMHAAERSAYPMSAPFCVRCTSAVCVCGVGR